ncbi:MAG: hydroxymethylglutaryl-CoA synthase family protein [Deltaproteobacteria bacterium]|nr:hydroxymethylglutaryl-CoA synthase family protein [Deltaproteobacteria bacterium]
MVGIAAYSVYLPRYRLERSKIAAAWGTSQSSGEVAVANYDEDALTMAIEAATGCFTDSDVSLLDGFYFASTSAPYREKQMASVAATACDLPRRCHTSDFCGSSRASLSALLAGFYALRAGALRSVVVAAGETRVAQPESEMEGLLGDAAAALRLGTEDLVAEFVDATSVSEEFTHFWRTDEQRFVQAFPGKFSNTYGYNKDLGEAIRILLERQKLEPGSVARLALYSPDARAAADLARELGFDPKRQLISPPVAAIGSAGAADALLALAIALEEAKPGDLIIVGAYGEGADALLLRATEAVTAYRPRRTWKQWLEAKLMLSSYEKYLKYRRVVEIDEAGEAINNVLEFKELRQDVRLYGSRCGACGLVQYPMAQVCLQCKARAGLTDHKLSKQGTIFTFTIDNLIANLEHPLPMAVVDLEGGGRVYLQVTDFSESEVTVGATVGLTFRRLHEGGGNHNYFWKARPLR